MKIEGIENMFEGGESAVEQTPELPAQAPPAAPPAKEPPAVEGEESDSPEARYIVTGKDVGKTLSALRQEVVEQAVLKLTDMEEQVIDQLITRGYPGYKVTLSGRERSLVIGLWAPDGSAIEQVDRLLLEESKTTSIGQVRLISIFTLASYLTQYGEHWPSYPYTKDGQEKARSDSEEARRRVFDSEAGLVCRIAFCRNLSSPILERLVHHVQSFQALIKRATSYDRVENF